jgi:DNA-binding beta-propeller fold protein YncE
MQLVFWGWLIGSVGFIAWRSLPLAARGRTQPDTPNLVFGEEGEHDGQFHMPREIGFSPDQREMYILDRSHRVQVFDREGGFLRLWNTPEGVWGNPRGLDVGSDGTVYVADTHNSQVLTYSPDGRLLRRLGRRGKAPGEFMAVTDVAIDPDGCLWTCEYGGSNDRIQKFDAAGKVLLTSGGFGSEPGRFSRPQGITAGPDHRIFVADAVNHRVQILDRRGRLLAVWGGVGTAPGKMKYPYCVTLDQQGLVYVAEFENNRISVFSPDGRFLTWVGHSGRAPNGLNNPWGVAVARNGDIYVADTMNYRIQRFAPLAGFKR